MVPGDNGGVGLGPLRPRCQDFPVETKDGSWVGQSLDGETGLNGQVLADEAGVHQEQRGDRFLAQEKSGGAGNRKGKCSPTLPRLLSLVHCAEEVAWPQNRKTFADSRRLRPAWESRVRPTWVGSSSS